MSFGGGSGGVSGGGSGGNGVGGSELLLMTCEQCVMDIK